jgi:predicted ATPase
MALRKIKDFFIQFPEMDMFSYLNHFLSFLGYPLPDDINVTSCQWQRETNRVVINLFRNLAKKHSMCLIIEDAHWLDHSSEDLIDQLIDEIVNVPLLLCLVLRSERKNELFRVVGEEEKYFKVEWDLTQPQITHLEISKLAPDAAEQLIKLIIDSDSLPDFFYQVIHEGKALNPLFIEEIIRKLIYEELLIQGKNGWVMNGNITKEHIPDNLKDILKERVNRLNDNIRVVLQAGAVLGNKFALNLLEFIEDISEGLDDKLATLEGLDFIHQYTDNDNEIQYMFRHSLTHEVAYNSLMHKKKRQIHAKVVEALLSLYGEESEVHYPMLAYHATQAGLPKVAYQYLNKMASRAKKQFANHEAIQCYEQIL